jgi:broad specificity phosphatase PhoE
VKNLKRVKITTPGCFLILTVAIPVLFGSVQVFGQSLLQNAGAHYLRQLNKPVRPLEFYMEADFPERLSSEKVLQIMLIRHGKPAIGKKSWMNRKAVIRYQAAYDSVGVELFETAPVALNGKPVNWIYTSRLPRAVHTAQLMAGDSIPVRPNAQYNEFERKPFCFFNVPLPRGLWSGVSRGLWMLGVNDRGIESYAEAKIRARRNALVLEEAALRERRVLLVAHGFMNRYIRTTLKKGVGPQ